MPLLSRNDIWVGRPEIWALRWGEDETKASAKSDQLLAEAALRSWVRERGPLSLDSAQFPLSAASALTNPQPVRES